MAITFRVSSLPAPTSKAATVVQLMPDNWDDYSYKTMFRVVVHKSDGTTSDLGTVKVGYENQPHGRTQDAIPKQFDALPAGWFSLGQDVDYYQKIREFFSQEDRDAFLRGVADVVTNEVLLTKAQEQNVFRSSLMRDVSLSVIFGQYKRVLEGLAILSEFEFAYRDPGNERHAAIDVTSHVKPASKPPTNLHVLIGRNGVGKTTLLNNMVSAIVTQDKGITHSGRFYEQAGWKGWQPLSENYFSSVISVSFSAFDPFVPPADRPDRSQGVAYFYVGMKKSRLGYESEKENSSKSGDELATDFIESLKSCLSQSEKRERWRTAISRLESDSNFEDMKLKQLLETDMQDAIKRANNLVGRMSSGHSIVLLTITKLVDTVEEKTLVLMDEPESHLHPPLLSAFTRALSELLHNRNGVAIIATHSPVVVQEVPNSCVWKLTRLRTEGRADRPERETFGENVGVLTRDIFGLEVSKSGFHSMLQAAVDEQGTFESILAEYDSQLGFEAQGILRTMIAARDAKKSNLQ
jgi:predicted ATPase